MKLISFSFSFFPFFFLKKKSNDLNQKDELFEKLIQDKEERAKKKFRLPGAFKSSKSRNEADMKRSALLASAPDAG